MDKLFYTYIPHSPELKVISENVFPNAFPPSLLSEAENLKHSEPLTVYFLNGKAKFFLFKILQGNIFLFLKEYLAPVR